MRRLSHPLLLVLVCGHLLVLAMELPRPWTDLVNLLTAPLYARLLFSIRARRWEAMTLLVLASAAPLANLAISWGTSLPLDLVKVAFWTVTPLYLAWKTFLAIYDAETIARNEIVGAVTLYLLIGLVFANIYEALFLVDPDALRFDAGFATGTIGFGEVLYFSYVTLATLGYGDISPGHSVARIAAVSESVIGILYIAVLITRFVGLHTGRHRPAGDR